MTVRRCLNPSDLVNRQQDPSQQAMMGQMQSGVYYGTGTGYGGGMTTQNTGSAGMSHMNQASAGYPSSPGHSVGYGMQSGQQVHSATTCPIICNGSGVHRHYQMIRSFAFSATLRLFPRIDMSGNGN